MDVLLDDRVRDAVRAADAVGALGIVDVPLHDAQRRAAGGRRRGAARRGRGGRRRVGDDQTRPLGRVRRSRRVERPVIAGSTRPRIDQREARVARAELAVHDALHE